ncbi:MAG: YtxH domain-containing protein [Chloroflexi bacterium]|nr:YtxH domain-containing protein [Chloroflexota bacterium]
MVRKILVFGAGLLAGAIIGAGVSLLLTPASGDELREGTKDRYKRILDESVKAAAERRAQLEAELAEMTRPKKVNEKANGQ